MSVQDYGAFVARLKREFPLESFLIVRYGDHQPEFAAELHEPGASPETISQRMVSFDPRYFSTYYSIDAINFKPRNMNAALATLDAPYLPLVVQQLAGLPLDASFTEQKKSSSAATAFITAVAMARSRGGFNRLLINAGLIKGL